MLSGTKLCVLPALALGSGRDVGGHSWSLEQSCLLDGGLCDAH